MTKGAYVVIADPSAADVFNSSLGKLRPLGILPILLHVHMHQLAKPAAFVADRVVLLARIHRPVAYDLARRLVRTQNLGHRPRRETQLRAKAI